jgi:Protein of unknown function (DUF1639)
MGTMATTTSLLEELPRLHVATTRLHNFIFPTAGWGAGQILCCRKETTVYGGESGESLKEVPCISKERSISPEAAESAELPWDLRRRRGFSKGESSQSAGGAPGKGKRNLSVSLSLKEIDADFLAMNGKKPHKRPKKRPKHMQKQIDVS